MESKLEVRKAAINTVANRSVKIFCDKCGTVKMHYYRGCTANYMSRNKIDSFSLWYGCDDCGKQRKYGCIERLDKKKKRKAKAK